MRTGPVGHFTFRPVEFAILCDSVRRSRRTAFGLRPRARAALYLAAAGSALPAAALAGVRTYDCRFARTAGTVCGLAVPPWAAVPLKALAAGVPDGGLLWPGEWADGANADAMVLDDYRRITPPLRGLGPDQTTVPFESFLRTRRNLLKRGLRLPPVPESHAPAVRRPIPAGPPGPRARRQNGPGEPRTTIRIPIVPGSEAFWADLVECGVATYEPPGEPPVDTGWWP